MFKPQQMGMQDHVVWISKYRKKWLYGELRKNLGDVFHELARQKECKMLEGHLQPNHVHILFGTATQ
jgi:putative transposase